MCPSPVLQPHLDQLHNAGTAEAVRFAVEDIAALQRVEAVPTLIEVLGYNNPGAAVAAVEGLIALGKPAVLPLLELLDGYNYGARAWALRALAGIGDPRGLTLLATAAREDFALSVRRAAARGLGTLHWQWFTAGDRPTAQTQALETLLLVCDDPEWVVRYAAVTGLESLGLALEPALEQLQLPLAERLRQLAQADEAIALQARAKLALQRLGQSVSQACPR